MVYNMKAKYEKDGNIEMWHYKDDIWYQETTHTFDALNPYLCDSDWDCNPEDEIVCEFVLDGFDKEGREEVRELNKLLENGSQVIELLIETLKVAQ